LPAIFSMVTVCLQIGDDGEVVLGENAGILLTTHAQAVATAQNPRVSATFATTQAAWHRQQGDLPQAHQFATQAVTISQDFPLLHRIDALIQLGYVQVAQQKWAAAKATWQQVLEIRLALKHPIQQLEATANLAIIAVAENELAIAKEHVNSIWDYLATPPLHLAGIQEPMAIFTACQTYFEAVTDDRQPQLAKISQAWLNTEAYRFENKTWRALFYTKFINLR
jgi:hypothetical protein